ncbi:MAG: hypothetical protein IPH58_17330 [Sphingobacteriales bacterium]|nr:hypothetical protein [Sphingobacteriales bacterium]
MAGGATRNERNEQDANAPLGIATTGYQERIVAAMTGSGHAAPSLTITSICGAGVLFMLPALISLGIIEVYRHL